MASLDSECDTHHRAMLRCETPSSVGSQLAPQWTPMERSKLHGLSSRRRRPVTRSTQDAKLDPNFSRRSNLPNMKNTKKQSSNTLPNIGRVSSSNVTKIRIPARRKHRHRGRWKTFRQVNFLSSACDIRAEPARAVHYSLGILLMALSGRSTLTVLMAVKLTLPISKMYSIPPAITIKQSRRFQ